jgi:ubiquinone/menaquinone biosynthesis C-methylase UbiE
MLPFCNDTFDAVLHFGGINFFNDKERAIAEMIRVAKPGATIVIGDETEKHVTDSKLNSQFYEKPDQDLYLPPSAYIPPTMEDQTVRTLWKGKIYLITFIKPKNLDIHGNS